MIRAGELKATVAKALHLPEKKVEYPYRVGLEAGEISKGKRGRGGASVTTADAAKTLIAVASTYIGDEVILGLQDFSRLELTEIAQNNYSGSPTEPAEQIYSEKGWTTSDVWEFPGFQIPQLQSLPAGHTFAEALTALIDAAEARAFRCVQSHSMNIEFHGPEASADLTVQLRDADGLYYVEEATYRLPDRDYSAGDDAFEIVIRFDQQPIYEIADLFRYRGADESGRKQHDPRARNYLSPVGRGGR